MSRKVLQGLSSIPHQSLASLKCWHSSSNKVHSCERRTLSTVNTTVAKAFNQNVSPFSASQSQYSTTRYVHSGVCLQTNSCVGSNRFSFLHHSYCPQIRYSSTSVAEEKPYCLDAKDEGIFKTLSEDMIVVQDFLTEEEESSLLKEVDGYMKRLRYEFDHWDNAIHGYRETEKRSWNEANTQILQRVKDIAFQTGVSPLAYVHVLDIAKDGYIKPHVDAVRFCGDTIAGMSLLSSCVMRLSIEKDKTKFADILLPHRSLYIMKHKARYDFTHEVLKDEESIFKGQRIARERRISIICRNEPDPECQD